MSSSLRLPLNSLRAAIFLFFLLASFSSGSQAAQVDWIRTRDAAEATPAAFENFVFEYFRASGSTAFRPGSTTADSLPLQLRILQERGPAAVVIQCTLPEYLRLLRDPEGKLLLSNLGLKLLNARLFTYPFYLIESPRHPETDRMDVAWITLPESDVHAVEDADLLTMLSEALGRPRNMLRVVRERGAYPAAKKLQGGTYRVLGIYEDEPSTLLEEFGVNWSEELRAQPFAFHVFESARTPEQLVPVSPNRFSYSYFQYGERVFDTVPVNQKVLAIAHEVPHPFPVLLSNVPNAGVSRELHNALSYSYFLMVGAPEIRTAPEPLRKRIEQIYLLNAYLEDPSSRTKGLGLLGAFLLRKEDLSSKKEQETYGLKCELFQRQLQLPEIEGTRILNWMGITGVPVGRRELFSSDISRLYEEALAQIDKALKTTGNERVSWLQKARSNLAAPLLQGSRPRKVQGSRGLWSVADYNPYYQLARVALYLELEKVRAR